MTNITRKEAEETKIFVIGSNGVEETNLYEFVMISAEETTSPRGVETKLHIRHSGYDAPRFASYAAYPNEEDVYEVWNWGFRGQNPSIIDGFETEAEAEDFIFQRTYDYDFSKDDQRDTNYYYSYEEAYEDYLQRLSEVKSKDIEVIKRWLSFCEYCQQAQSERATKSKTEYNERIDKLSDIYAKMIEAMPESYKQTCGRLKVALNGERIETAVFHAAIKKIRNNQ